MTITTKASSEQPYSGREQRHGRQNYDLRNAVNFLLELRRQQLEPRLHDADRRREQIRERAEQATDRSARDCAASPTELSGS